MDPYKTPEGPKLANLGVVVVLRVNNENLSQKRESNRFCFVDPVLTSGMMLIKYFSVLWP